MSEGSAQVSRRVARSAAVLALLPIPLWFGWASLRDPGPAWRAELHDAAAPAGPGVIVAERQLSHYWDRSNQHVVDGIDVHSLSGRWDTCLELTQAREIPFMLVASGRARFEIDAEETLSVASDGARATTGGVFRLEPGVHHLSVDFSASGWPSIGLLASFDEQAPRAFPADTATPGVRVTHPEPGAQPCPRAH
jgi:hypothetical protein